MDSSTITMIVIGVILLLAWYFFSRNRVMPRGTYDDEDHRSSGSIGRGQRAYDDPDFRSSGTIGGNPTGRRSRPRHDSEKFKSGGSIGG